MKPESTTPTRPTDSRQDGREKWVTGATNTIKLPTQGTTIGKCNSLYTSRLRLYSCISQTVQHDDHPGYASASDHDNEQVEMFYEYIEEVIVIVQGNWNAKVSPCACRNCREIWHRGDQPHNLLEVTVFTSTPISCFEPQTSKLTGKLVRKHIELFWFRNASSSASTRRKQEHSLAERSAVTVML